MYFLGLVEPLNPDEIKDLMQRFRPPPKLAAAILNGKEAADQALLKLLRLGEAASRSQIYRLLAPLDTEFLLYMMAKSRQPTTKRLISLYFTHLKHLKPELTGRDLIAMGYQPGPQIKQLLSRLHEARLNEVVQSKQEEIELIRRIPLNKAAS